jgi:2,4-dienoyl-CoA reductase (NADPH2)
VAAEAIFRPLRFRNLEVGNRIFRSNVAGRLDDYDGAGTQTRINWELKFARGGVGAILSSWTAVDERGKIVPGFAGIESEERIPFWRELGERVHEHGCRYIVQLAHAGRQRDVPTLAFGKGLSSTSEPDPLHGFECERATKSDLEAITRSFAAGARRAREAGLDGVELHGANGYLFTQFLSSAINDREDEYGGPLENRARLLLETLRAVRAEVGDDFHVQVKISTTEHANAFLPWLPRGNTIEDSVQVCRWLEEAGADAIHVSSGSTFPHPENPAGEFSVEDMVRTYDVMLSSGVHTFRNYLMFRLWPANRIMQRRWERDPAEVPARCLPDAQAVKQAVGIPVIVTGGFQRASLIADAIERGACDAVSIGRGLVANNDLVELFRAGHDVPPRPCTYCNKCLYSVLEHPIGCYDERRFASREEMVEQILSVYAPAA